MGSNSTVIYYSSNREKPDFEKRVMENLMQVKGDLPVVSVTQTRRGPVDGVLVGDVGTSGFNMFRQVLIALEQVKTKFVISAESDCLYPPDYFTYEPERDDACYRNSNLYVMPDARDYFFYKKEGATHAQAVGTEFYKKRLEQLFKGAPEWNPEEKNFPKERWGKEDVFEEIQYYKTENPVFQIKTHRGMRYYTHSDRTPIHGLPYWGDGRKIRSYYLHGKVI